MLSELSTPTPNGLANRPLGTEGILKRNVGT